MITRVRSYTVGMVGLAGLVAVLCGCAGGSHQSVSQGAGTTSAARSRLASGYGRLPLAFEQNVGQAPTGVSFLARGQGYAIGLSSTGPVLSLLGGSAGRGIATLSSRFVGAAAHSRLVSSGLLPGRVNYLTGNDPQRWHIGVPTFEHVRYVRVWPGIDASFTGRQGRLEFNYRVAPGADPRRIVVGLAGARSLRVDRAGELIVGVHGGSVRELAPHAYQLVGGQRRTVASRYVVRGRRVSIAVGRYDHRMPLVIDPTLVYSTYIGGSGTDAATEIAVDSSGDAYIAGGTSSSDFPTKSGAFQTTYGGGKEDAFVSKVNATGTALLYSTYLGGSGADYAAGIVIDPAGDAYLSGHTASSDFPTTAGAFQTTLKGTADAFVAKLNPAGSGLVYSTYLGGASGGGDGAAIAVDASGDAYVDGETSSPSFPTTPGAFQPAFSGDDHDAFVTKLNPTGTALVYSTYLAGSMPSSSGTEAYGIAVDSSGNSYISGYTKQTDFPTTPGAFQPTLKGTENAFVTKLNPAGSALVYSTFLGGSGKDAGFRLTVDSSGDAYVTGGTGSSDFPTTAGAFQKTLKGNTNAFVTKLNPAGTALVYSTFLGGSATSAGCAAASLSSCEGGLDIVIDSAGEAYVTGETASSNFPTTPGAYQTAYGGQGDAFATELNATGTGLVYSTYLGGHSLDAGSAIAVDAAGDVFVTGGTESTNFPTTPGALQTTLKGLANAFVLKLGSSAHAQHTLTVTKNGAGSGTVTSSPPGVVCGATCSASFDAGSQVILSAASDPGSTFGGWSGAGCSGVGTCTVTMSNDESVTATFTTSNSTCTRTFAGRVKGDLTVPAGQVYCLDASVTVDHDVVVMAGGTLLDLGATIGHDLTVAGMATVCGATIDHDLRASGPVTIGGSACDGNTIGHDLVVQNDQSGATIEDNVIGHDLDVENDAGGVTVDGNHAGHDATCRNNTGQTGTGNTAAHANTCPS